MITDSRFIDLKELSLAASNLEIFPLALMLGGVLLEEEF